MGKVLFLCFVGVPIAEIWLFMTVGGWIGIAPTLSIVLLTAALGAALARHEGLSVLAQLQAKLSRGEVPAAELKSAFAIAAGGLLLLTPGFLTDFLGLLLLFPPTRALILGVAARYLPRAVDLPPGAGSPDGDVIDLPPDAFEVK